MRIEQAKLRHQPDRISPPGGCPITRQGVEEVQNLLISQRIPLLTLPCLAALGANVGCQMRWGEPEGWEALTSDAVPQELRQGLCPDLPHTATGLPLSDDQIHQVGGIVWSAAAVHQIHNIGQYRQVAAPPGFRLECAAVLELLNLETVKGPRPISNRLRCLPIGDVGGTLEAVTLAHQNVDIANPGQNITHRPLGPIKREEGGLLGMAGQPNLQPDLPSELTHAPALGRTGGAWLCRGGVVLLTP